MGPAAKCELDWLVFIRVTIHLYHCNGVPVFERLRKLNASTAPTDQPQLRNCGRSGRPHGKEEDGEKEIA